MAIAVKKWIFISIFCAFSVPFIAVQTFYPFYRFGMFAEPQRQSPENLSLYLRVEKQNTILFDPTSIGLTHSQWNYLLRKYFYTKRLPNLCKNLKMLTNRKESIEWLCICKRWSPKKSQIQIDTLAIQGD